jgi:hypothetical protein
VKNSPAAPFAIGERLIGLITCVFIAALVFLGMYQLRPPAPVPADAPPTEFSSGRALQYVQVIAREPHPIGSPEHARVRDYIVKMLTDLGLRPEIQRTSIANPLGRVPFPAGTVQNIVAKLPGTAPGKAILLAAHYDSVMGGPGANDDGAAVAALLETARALKAGPALKNDVIFLITDGEEAGLLGSTAFVREHPWAKDVGVALNFEARGSSGPVLMFQTSDLNGWLIQEFAQAAPDPFASSLFDSVYRRLPNATDFTMFGGSGMAGYNFAYIDGFLIYHTALDNFEHLGEPSLQHHGSSALALARHFGDIGLDNTKAGNAIYFNAYGPILVHYSETLAIPLMILVLILFIGIVVIGFRNEHLTFRGIILGFFAFLLNVIVASVAVSVLLQVIFIVHRQYGLIPHGDTYNSRLYLISFVALAIAITSALYVLFHRRTRVQNLAIGALIWWLILAVVSSLLLPGGSYLFIWPLLFSLLGLAIALVSKSPESAFTQRFIAILLCSVPAILLFTPLIYLLFVTLTIRMSIVVMVVSVLLLGLLLPHLTFMATPHRWWLPGAMALVCVGFLVAGALTSGFDARHPRPDNVLYGLDADSGKAVWASTNAQPDVWTAQFFPADTMHGTLDAFFPLVQAQFMTSQAPAASLPAPQAELLEDRSQGDVRSLRLRLTSPRQAPMLFVDVDPKTQVLGAAVDGKRLPDAGGATPLPPGTPWQMLYWALPPEGIELTLEVPRGQPVAIRLVDRTPGLPAIAGLSTRPRPEGIMPAPSLGIAQFSDSTMVGKSVTFNAP